MKKYALLTVGAIVLAAFALWTLSRSRTFQVFGELYAHVDTNEKVVALTFDDGPTMKTDSILAILNELQIKATFFVIGKDLEKYDGQAQKIVLAGHQLGNHTFSHQRMVMKSFGFVQKEVTKTDSLIRRVGYQGEILFRPPYGKKLFMLPYYLKQTDRKTIMWDVEPESYAELAKDSARITAHVLEKTRPGSIILLHVMYNEGSESVKAIKGIVTGLTQRGYVFKTVTELLHQ